MCIKLLMGRTSQDYCENEIWVWLRESPQWKWCPLSKIKMCPPSATNINICHNAWNPTSSNYWFYWGPTMCKPLCTWEGSSKLSPCSNSLRVYEGQNESRNRVTQGKCGCGHKTELQTWGRPKVIQPPIWELGKALWRRCLSCILKNE